MRQRFGLIVVGCCLCVPSMAQQPALTVGTATSVAGRTVTGFIEVPAASDAGTNIPVAVIRGAKPGPTLALVAGAHGTEYASIIALEKLIQELDPAAISGAVIVVPLVNIASAIKYSGNTIQQARLAVGAVAARPYRLAAVEQAIAGKPRSEETAAMAGELAVQGATALRYNAYKIPLMRNLVKRAIRGTGEAARTT
jgi:predicted deacylase